MNDPSIFWTIFSAVLSAILLGGMFFGALISYSRLEREGRELQAPFHYWIGMLLPVAFLLMGLYTAL